MVLVLAFTLIELLILLAVLALLAALAIPKILEKLKGAPAPAASGFAPPAPVPAPSGAATMQGTWTSAPSPLRRVSAGEFDWYSYKHTGNSANPNVDEPLKQRAVGFQLVGGEGVTITSVSNGKVAPDGRSAAAFTDDAGHVLVKVYAGGAGQGKGALWGVDANGPKPVGKQADFEIVP